MDDLIKTKMLDNLRDYLHLLEGLKTNDKGEQELRKHQIKMLSHVVSFLETPVGESIPNISAEDTNKIDEIEDANKLDEIVIKLGEFFEINSATGTGKTRAFGTMAKVMDVPALFVTPRNLLNKQTKEEFCREIGIDEDEVAVYDSKQSDRERSRLLDGPVAFQTKELVDKIFSRTISADKQEEAFNIIKTVLGSHLDESLTYKNKPLLIKNLIPAIQSAYAANPNQNDKFAQFLGDVQSHDKELSSDNPLLHLTLLDVPPPPKFVITSYQSLPTLVNRHELDFTNPADAHYRPLVVLDEVHKAQGEETVKILKELKNKVLLAGFTATDAGAADRLFDGQAPIYTLPIVKAVEDGLLCNAVHTGVIDVRLEDESSFESQVGKLIDTIFAQGVSPEQKREAYEAINKVLSLRGSQAITEQDINDPNAWSQKLTSGINARYTGQSVKLGRFLDAVQKTEIGLSNNNPLKTYKNNSEWVNNLIQTAEGREYKREDVERFAQDDSINMGAIRFHLDPTEQQQEKLQEMGFSDIYRLPTIFYTQGVKAARKGAKLYNQEAQRLGRPSKAAFISGDESRDEFDKIADRDTIIERFNNGELQALYNDSVLEMGFNSPKAAICYSLKPTQLPHVAEQQLGRITRKFGDKIALAINVRAEGMTPYLFGEVLGNAPAVFSRNYTPKPKDIEKRVRALCAFMASNDLDEPQRQSLCDSINKVLGEQLSSALIPERLGAVSDILVGAIVKKYPRQSSALGAFLRDVRAEINNNDHPIHTYRIVDKTSTSTEPIEASDVKVHINYADMQSVVSASAKAHENLPTKTDEWLTVKQAKRKSGKSQAIMDARYRTYKSAWESAIEAGNETFSVEGMTYRTDQAGIFRSGTHTPFCMHDSVIEQSQLDRSSILPKPGNFLTASDMAKRVKGTTAPIYEKYELLEDAWESAVERGELTFTAAGITLRTDQGCIYQAGSKYPFCLEESAVEQFINSNKKTPGWLSLLEMKSQIGPVRAEALYKAAQPAWEAAIAAEQDTFTVEGIEIRTDQANLFQSARGDTFCLHESLLKKLAIPDKTDDWLSKTAMTAKAKLNPDILTPIYEALHAAWASAVERGDPTFTAHDITLRVDQGAMFGTGKNRFFYLHETAAEHFIVPDKTDDWLTGTEMAEEAKKDPARMRRLYEQLQIAWKEAKVNGEATFAVENITIPTDKAGIFQAESSRPFCLHKTMVKHFAVPLKTAEWLNPDEMARETNRSKQTVQAMYNTIQPIWKEAEQKGESTFRAPRGLIFRTDQAGFFQARTRTAFCMNQSAAPQLTAHQKPNDFLINSEMAELIGKNENTLAPVYRELRTAWEQALEEGKDTFTAYGITLNIKTAGMYKMGTADCFCLHESTADALRHFFDTPHPPTARIRVKPSPIKPEDIKITGQER